jgi:hypothetical protein
MVVGDNATPRLLTFRELPGTACIGGWMVSKQRKFANNFRGTGQQSLLHLSPSES